jgi:nucleotide-binding universal stress UspA family protein
MNSSEMKHSSNDRDEVTRPRGGSIGFVVVIGLDGSDPSWHAFSWACGETRRLHGRAIAVLVSPVGGTGCAVAACDPTATGTMIVGALIQAETEKAEELRSQAFLNAIDHDIDLKFVHVDGDPASQLARIAEANQADLIVVGKSKKAWRYFGGSLGRRLIGRGGAPIIVVVPCY